MTANPEEVSAPVAAHEESATSQPSATTDVVVRSLTGTSYGASRPQKLWTARDSACDPSLRAAAISAALAAASAADVAVVSVVWVHDALMTPRRLREAGG